MKKWFVLFLLMTSTLNFAQNYTAFKSGEYLKLKLSYSGFLNAGYATLNVTESSYNGKPVYYVKGFGANTGLSRIFFRVEDYYNSYFDKETGLPYLAERNIREGSYKRQQNAYFNRTTSNVLLKDLGRKKEKNIDVPKGTLDVVSMFYYLRNYEGVEKLKEGQSIDVDIFFDDEVIKFRLKFLRREKVKTKFGTLNSMVFRPLVQAGRVFKEQESLTVWISDDKNRIPLKLKADLAVGSINADLEEYKGLKYPLNE